MKTTELSLNEQLDRLLIEFEESLSKMISSNKKKDIENFWEIFFDVAIQSWDEEDIVRIEKKVNLLPDKVINKAADYLRGEGMGIDLEFSSCFWSIEPFMGKRKGLFLNSFLNKYEKHKPSQLLYLAYKSYNDKDYLNALEYLNVLIEEKNELWTPRSLLTEVYQELGNYHNALIQAKLVLETLDGVFNIVKEEPEDEILKDLIWSYQIDAYLKLSFLYEKLKEYNQAANQYEYLITKGVNLPNLNGHCSYLYNRAGNFKKTVEYAQREIENSNAEYAHWNKVEGLRKLKNKKGAIEAFSVLESISKKKKALNKEKSLIQKIKSSLIVKTNQEDSIQEIIPHKLKTKYASSFRTDKKHLEREDILENLLFLRIKSGVKTFNKSLEIFENKYYFGKQLFAGKAGILDLLLVEKRKNILWVIELKRNHDYNDAFEQTRRYMKWVKKNIANSNQEVRGIICLFQPSELLLSQIKNEPDIELHTYEFSFKKLA